MTIRIGKHSNGTVYARLELQARGTLGHVEGTGGDRIAALAALADTVASTIQELEAELETIDALITAETPKVAPERCAETADMFVENRAPTSKSSSA